MLTEIIRIKLDKLYSSLDKLNKESDTSALDNLKKCLLNVKTSYQHLLKVEVI